MSSSYFTFEPVGISMMAGMGVLDVARQLHVVPGVMHRSSLRLARAAVLEPRQCRSRGTSACVTRLPGGTPWVSQTLPPMEEPFPMVTRPRIVAPA